MTDIRFHGIWQFFNIVDPDPFSQDQHVIGPHGSGSISQRSGSDFGSFPFLINVLSGLKYCIHFNTNFSKKCEFLRLKTRHWKGEKKNWFFKSLKSGFKIRIRIGSVFNRTSGSGSVFGIRIRIQEGKNVPQKYKKIHVLKCWMASFVSCRLLL